MTGLSQELVRKSMRSLLPHMLPLQDESLASKTTHFKDFLRTEMIEAKQAVKAYQKVSESFGMQEDKVKQEHAKKKTQLDKLESV
jgi:hypothetical protein